MCGARLQVFRHGSQTVTRNLYILHSLQLLYNHKTEKGMIWAFETSEPTPSDILPTITVSY